MNWQPIAITGGVFAMLALVVVFACAESSRFPARLCGTLVAAAALAEITAAWVAPW